MANPVVKNMNAFDVANNLSFSGLRKNAKGGKMMYLNTGGNTKVFFEMPVLRAPFGLSSFTDQKSGSVSYSLDVSMDDPVAISKIRDIEEAVLSHVVKNSEELLGRVYSIDVIKQALFKSCIRESKDGKYAPTLKLKVMHNDGVFSVDAYDATKKSTTLDALQKGQRVKTIVDFNQVWIIDNKFGLSVRLKQVMMMPTTELRGCAFSSGGGSDDGEDDFVDGVVKEDDTSEQEDI
jgi:hypothetical protein